MAGEPEPSEPGGLDFIWTETGEREMHSLEDPTGINEIENNSWGPIITWVESESWIQAFSEPEGGGGDAQAGGGTANSESCFGLITLGSLTFVGSAHALKNSKTNRWRVEAYKEKPWSCCREEF